MFDLFVTHDWRENCDRSMVLSEIDNVLGLNWRNYGNIWFDPIINFSSVKGSETLKIMLECQLIYSKAIILIPTIYNSSNRGRKWIEITLSYANKLSIPVIGVIIGTEVSNEVLKSYTNQWVNCDGKIIVELLRSILN